MVDFLINLHPKTYISMKNILFYILFLFQIALAQTYLDPIKNQIIVWNHDLEKCFFITDSANIQLKIGKMNDFGMNTNVQVFFPKDFGKYHMTINDDFVFIKNPDKSRQVYYLISNKYTQNTSKNILLKENFEGTFIDYEKNEVMILEYDTLKSKGIMRYAKKGQDWMFLNQKELKQDGIGINYSMGSQVFKATRFFDEKEGINCTFSNATTQKFYCVSKSPVKDLMPLEIITKFPTPLIFIEEDESEK